jgi:DNA-binding NarL/FixJ family response regulator
VIQVLIVDDHPAVRAGIEAVVRIEPWLVPAGSCGGVAEALDIAERREIQVAVVDYDLSDGHGLEVCLDFQHRDIATLVYSAYSNPLLGVAALLAGASGLLPKSAGGDELCDAIRGVARGMRRFPEFDSEVLEICGRRVGPDDLPILGMLIESHTRREVAETLRLDERQLEHRLRRMVDRLRPPTGQLEGARQ